MYKWMLYMVMIIFCFSCTKEEPDCSGNCVDIHLSGRITDTATGKGVANVPMQVVWKAAGFCLFCNEQKAAESKTNGDGYFSITATVDKSWFGDYDLAIASSLPASYLQASYFAYISHYTSDTINLNQTAFPKATLTVRVIKNQPDSVTYFNLVYHYSPYGSVGLFTGEPMADTTFEVNTAADIYTYFRWTKYYGIGNPVFFSDSILCSATHDNVFTIHD